MTRRTINVDGADFCADVLGTLPGNLTISNAIAGACAAPPPPPGGDEIVIPSGMVRAASVRTAFGVQQTNPRMVDALHAASFLGIGPSQPAPGTHWPREDGTTAPQWLVDGAFLVLGPLQSNQIVIAELPPIPTAGEWSCSITPQSNVSGNGGDPTKPRLNLAVGAVGGVFDDEPGARVAVRGHYFDQMPCCSFGIGLPNPSGPLFLNIPHGQTRKQYVSISLAPGSTGHVQPWPVALIFHAYRIS